jgi:hypothetical protein
MTTNGAGYDDDEKYFMIFVLESYSELLSGECIASLIGAAVAKKKNLIHSIKFRLMDISLVIPLKDEEESLPELSEWISRVMNANNYSYEIILWMMAARIIPGILLKSLEIRIQILKGSNFSATMEICWLE